LRSAIAKEACATVNLLVKALGDAFEPLTEYFIPVLCKLTIITIEVISEAGNNCIRTIITYCRLGKAISKILENCYARHSALRTRCTEFVLLLLEVSAGATLDNYISDIEECIKAAIQDALPDVRQCARKCFWAFSMLYKDRATR